MGWAAQRLVALLARLCLVGPEGRWPWLSARPWAWSGVFWLQLAFLRHLVGSVSPAVTGHLGLRLTVFFPPVCLVLINGQGFRVSSGGAVPTVLAFPCGAAAESQFLTTAPLCLSIFLVKMCIFLFSKF